MQSKDIGFKLFTQCICSDVFHSTWLPKPCIVKQDIDPAEVESLLKDRETARKDKDWNKAVEGNSFVIGFGITGMIY